MKVRRANVVLTVTENEMDKYLARGFTIMDDSGKVIKEPVPRDINLLQKAFVEHTAEIEALKQKIAQLESQPKQVEADKPKRQGRKKIE